jgi:hypothetical protein
MIRTVAPLIMMLQPLSDIEIVRGRNIKKIVQKTA